MTEEYIGWLEDWEPVIDMDQEIVRCKDCRRATIDQSDHDYREPLWCELFRTDVKLDGFCAWGSRRGE